MEAVKKNAGRFQKEDTRQRARWARVRGIAGLILGDGLLVYMLMSGKIDMFFGVLFVAAWSAFCGWQAK